MEVRKRLSRLTDREIILAATVFAFLPSFLSFACEIALVAFILICRRTRQTVFLSPLKWWLLPLAPVAIIPPIVYRNYVGIAAGAGLVLLLILAIYIMRTMTESVFEESTEKAAYLSVPVTFVAIIEKIVYTLWPHLSTDKNLRCAGVFYNPNLFGTVIVFIILISVYKIISKRGNRKTYILIIVSNCVSMLFCGSFLGMAELAIGVFCLFLFNRNWKGVGFFSLLAAGGVGAVAAFPRLLPRIIYAYRSFDLRYRVWQLAIILFRETPIFGRGILTYMTFSPAYEGADLGFKVWVTTCAHSLLLDSLLCLGIVGTVIMCGFLAHLYLPIVKVWLKKLDRPSSALTMAMTVGVLFHGIMDETVAWPQVAVLFFLILSGTACRMKKE